MNYTIEQFDSSTYRVIDRENHREVCVCGDFEAGTDPKHRAQCIANALNATDAKVVSNAVAKAAEVLLYLVVISAFALSHVYTDTLRNLLQAIH